MREWAKRIEKLLKRKEDHLFLSHKFFASSDADDKKGQVEVMSKSLREKKMFVDVNFVSLQLSHYFLTVHSDLITSILSPFILSTLLLLLLTKLATLYT